LGKKPREKNVNGQNAFFPSFLRIYWPNSIKGKMMSKKAELEVKENRRYPA
jgi:hypothetical protein